MSRKRVKVAAGLFTIVASLSFFTTSAIANFLGGKWEISNIIYENINLEKKYSRVLWTAVDKWNGISSSFDLSPADSDETGYVAVKHLPRAEDNYLGWSGTYGYAIPYDDRGRENRSPYASADVVIVRYLCDKLDEDVNADLILTHHRRFRIDPPGDFCWLGRRGGAVGSSPHFFTESVTVPPNIDDVGMV